MKSTRIENNFATGTMWSLFGKKNGTILKVSGKPVVLESRKEARSLSHFYPTYVIDKIFVDIERITS